MAQVPVRSAEAQATAMLLSVRELLTRQRTQLANALRGHAAEFGLVAAKGEAGLREVIARAADAQALPEAAPQALARLAAEIDRVETRLADADKRLMAQHKASPMRRLLVLGSTAVIQHAKPGRSSPWLLSLLERKPRKLAAVALANKIARTAWAMMVSGEAYRQPAAA